MPLFPLDYSDRKPIGKRGETVSAIGIGTWAIRDYSRAEEVLVKAVELGLDLIDTAEMYGWGRSEELVGRVVRRVGRDHIFITTKLLPDHFTDRSEAVRALRESLRRLGVSEVDLVLIHWPNRSISIADQIHVLEALADEGLARYIGVSNFDRGELEEAIYAARRYEIVVDQVKYSALDKWVEKSSLLGYAIKKNVLIQAYTPLEKGRVAENHRLREIGRKYGKTAVQVALNYLISRPQVIAIPKTENQEHLYEIKGSLGWRLKPEDIEIIEEMV